MLVTLVKDYWRCAVRFDLHVGEIWSMYGYAVCRWSMYMEYVDMGYVDGVCRWSM